jgi:hypothetical protein
MEKTAPPRYFTSPSYNTNAKDLQIPLLIIDSISFLVTSVDCHHIRSLKQEEPIVPNSETVGNQQPQLFLRSG